MEHKIEVKVFYEDTDCLGIVYHANYLKYMERGRSEFISASGKPIQEYNQEGYNFAVYEMKIKFKKPGKLGDILQVITKAGQGGSDYRKKMIQRIELDDQLLVEAEVDIVCLNNDKQLRTIPAGIFD